MPRAKTQPQDAAVEELEHELEAETTWPALRVQRLHPDAKLPTYATEGAACFDIYALNGGELAGHPDSWGHAREFRTGLAFDIPPGFALLIYSRSGLGFKNGVRLANAVGVIDSDYKGELLVKLHNDGVQSYRVEAGHRIAQAQLVYAPQTEIVEVDSVTASERGAGGIGSTGR